jgi:fibronectin type 3 domain-containing protein
MDTHVVHFHLANVQVINRMGWDGTVKPPDPTELGWKETVKMNPLEDIVVALQPDAPVLPFSIPDSYRPLDVTMPVGSTSGFTGVDPAGNPVTVTNPVTFFGWEYVWNGQMLSHEENDMMRPLIMVVEPFAPTSLVASVAGPGLVDLTWVDTAFNETGFRIERAVNGGAFTPLITVASNTIAYSDATVTSGNTYSYRVIAVNAYGESAPSNVATVTVVVPAAPTLAAVATALSTNPPSVTLTWNNAGGLTGLTLQRATSPGFSAGLTSFPQAAAATTFTDTTVANTPTAYYYRIQAVNIVGPSPWSTPPRVVNDLGQLPAMPNGLVVATTTRNSVSLSWTANLTAGPVLSYTIQRSANLTGPWTTLTTVAAPTTTYTNTGLARRTNYRYRIQAVNASGVSVFTAVVTGLTL